MSAAEAATRTALEWAQAVSHRAAQVVADAPPFDWHAAAQRLEARQVAPGGRERHWWARIADGHIILCRNSQGAERILWECRLPAELRDPI